ncbi:MAG: CAP domain-containing protein [bacterium]|nr:CAP domain-containing protein [bacterium]
MKKIVTIIVVLTLLGGGAIGFVSLNSYIKELNSEISKLNREKEFLEEFRNRSIAIRPTPEEVLKEVNALIRVDAGVDSVILDDKLNASALLKAQDMVQYNYYDHVNPKTKKHGYEYITYLSPNECVYIGENIARGSVSVSAKDRVDSWRNSKSHYEAMIDPRYSKIGFAEIFDQGPSRKNDPSTIAVLHFCQSK